MAKAVLFYLLAATAFIHRSNGIGENVGMEVPPGSTLNLTPQFDMSSLTGVVKGLGNMFDSVAGVDVQTDRLMGKWYQMYKAAINFDVFRAEMYCPVAYFKPNPIMGKGGFTMEEAYRTISKIGPIETYKRDVNRYGPGQYWMYTEEYFYPRQLIIISAGPDFEPTANITEIESRGNETEIEEEAPSDEKPGPYEYLIATDQNRLALMVFARDPLVFLERYNAPVLQFLRAKGFGGNAFWNTPKPIYQGADCEWPTSKEVFARRVLKNQRSSAGNPAPAPQGSILSGLASTAQQRQPVQQFGLQQQQLQSPGLFGGQQNLGARPLSRFLPGFGGQSAVQTIQNLLNPVAGRPNFGNLFANAIQG